MDVILTLSSNTALADGVAPDKARISNEFPYFGEPYSRDEQAVSSLGNGSCVVLQMADIENAATTLTSRQKDCGEGQEPGASGDDEGYGCVRVKRRSDSGSRRPFSATADIEQPCRKDGSWTQNRPHGEQTTSLTDAKGLPCCMVTKLRKGPWQTIVGRIRSAHADAC